MYSKVITTGTWITSCYIILSFNNNFEYFFYYDSIALYISLLLFIITATFSNLLINLNEMPIYSPHPLFWRFILCVQILYISFLLILLFQPTLNETRNLFRIFDSSLNEPITTKFYATYCNNYDYQVIVDKFDIFVFSHFIGWCVNGIFVRNRQILWLTQILWEIIEIVTQYIVPNFAECWWDQIFLDILLCNGLGIEFGLFIANYFQLEHYEWCYLWTWNNIKYKTAMFFGFFPCKILIDLDDHERPSFNINISKQKLIYECFWAFFGYPCQMLTLQLNSFLLKLWLWIPTNHPINAIRFSFLSLTAIPCIYQVYHGIIQRSRNIKCITWSGKTHKLGKHCYIWFVILGLEMIIIYRVMPYQQFPSMPLYNKIWMTSCITFLLVYLFILSRDYKIKRN